MSNLERRLKRDPDNLLWQRTRDIGKCIFTWWRCQHNKGGVDCGWKAISLQTITGDVQKTIKCLRCGLAVDAEASSSSEPLKEEYQYITLCWLKPTVKQFQALSEPVKQYVRSGGLLMGRIRVEVTE